jgi:lysophospholipid acyltransferase (LPLAT)-like uncharacterized protein
MGIPPLSAPRRIHFRQRRPKASVVRPFKTIFRSAFVQNAICVMVISYIRFVYWTSSWRRINEEAPNSLFESKTPFILAMWHGRIVMLGKAWRYGDAVTILASAHRDGRVLAGIQEGFGVSVVYGSTNKGGAKALRRLVGVLKNGGVVAITPDGPRGPRMRAAAGIVMLSRLSKAPIIPVAFATSRRRILSSWDKLLIPLPFSRGVFIWGDVIQPPDSNEDAVMENKRQTLEIAITKLTAQADQIMGQGAIEPAIDSLPKTTTPPS